MAGKELSKNLKQLMINAKDDGIFDGLNISEWKGQSSVSSEFKQSIQLYFENVADYNPKKGEKEVDMHVYNEML